MSQACQRGRKNIKMSFVSLCTLSGLNHGADTLVLLLPPPHGNGREGMEGPGSTWEKIYGLFAL